MKQQADIRTLIIVFLSLVALFSHAQNSCKPNIIYILTDLQSANALFIIRENHTIAGESKEEIANIYNQSIKQ